MFQDYCKKKNLKKYNDLKSIQEQKQELSIFKNFEKQYLNLSGCNVAKNRFCGSATCEKCFNQYYSYKLGCNKNNQNIGEFTLKSQLLLQILETHIRTLCWESNIWKKIQEGKIVSIVTLFPELTGIIDNKQHITFELIQESQKFAANQFLEKNFFSVIQNIIFFELNATPVPLGKQKRNYSSKFFGYNQ